MKIERVVPKPPFEPVTITIETQGELQVLYQVANHSHRISNAGLSGVHAPLVASVLQGLYAKFAALGINTPTLLKE